MKNIWYLDLLNLVKISFKVKKLFSIYCLFLHCEYTFFFFNLGGDISFANYEELENSFAKQEIHPGDLKSAVEIYLNKLLDPIRKEFSGDAKLMSLSNKAYPPPQKQS